MSPSTSPLMDVRSTSLTLEKGGLQRVLPRRNNKAHHHLLSGALSGLASSVLLQPLDLLKTRMQQGVGVASGSGVGRKGKGRQILPVFRQVIAEDGIQGLWRGTVPTVARNVPGVAVYFYLLSEIRYMMSNTGFFSSQSYPRNPPAIPHPISFSSTEPSIASSKPTSSPTQAPSKSSALPTLSASGNLLAGAIARTSVGFVLSPITVVKSRYESNLYPSYTSVPKALSSIIKHQGIKGLFQGFTATAIRDAPYAGIYVVFYEEGKVLADKLIKPEWGVPFAAIHTISGMSAAALATLATSPADCVKTRMQVLPEANPTIRAAISSIYHDRGLPGFLSGATLRISRKAASSAIGWTVYEGLLLFMRDKGIL